MTMIPTLAVLAVAVVLFAAALYLHRRPRNLGEVGLMPWGAIQFVALVVAVLTAAHLVSLFTGSPLIGRLGSGRF